ncbi:MULTISPECIES: SSI family serine proteinase inhibitor [unclassified Streptomyces]|uniref:SSI family serine proteinase inhibitor n=1 Tax=unclassified Streptomyces TaxID=2593676 RepID=UPI0016560841|nr:SSI family serine proteinase inhibitor [Streptomyces sp. CB02980]MCB8901205.1 subtilase-type protease inhibitor [Streptomyces sp. CB02980]
MPRFTGLALALALAALSTCSTASVASAAAAAPVPLDHLTLTVTDSADRASDGTYELICHPAAGTHPAPQTACDRLDELTTWGTDPFAPVPPDSLCTMQYGGPATAHVTGTWAGRPVDASYKRTDGCEIARWDDFAPVLPTRTGT